MTDLQEKKDSWELRGTGSSHLDDAMTSREIFPSRPSQKSGEICLYVLPQPGSVAKLPSPTWTAAFCSRYKMSEADSRCAGLYRQYFT